MKYHLFNKFIFLISICMFSACNDKSKDEFHPMVDGKNLEYKDLGITPLKISDDVNLYIYQNDAYVWISYDYPEGSFGTVDMIIESPNLNSALNLHVSAQLGEWPLDDETLIPKTPTSELWWNIDGWTANNLWANGIDTVSYDTPEFKIKNGEIRELQLSKKRFGKGEWKIKLKINAIRNKEGDFYSVEFPEDKIYHIIMAK